MTFPLCINYLLFVPTVVNKNCDSNYTLLLLFDTQFTIFPRLKDAACDKPDPIIRKVLLTIQ